MADFLVVLGAVREWLHKKPICVAQNTLVSVTRPDQRLWLIKTKLLASFFHTPPNW